MPILRVQPEIDIHALERARKHIDPNHPHLPPDVVRDLAKEVIHHLSRTDHCTTCENSAATEFTITALTDLLLADEVDAALEIILHARAVGDSVDHICRCYLAGVARELGNRWDGDAVVGTDIILGAGRIYALMRGLRRLFAHEYALRSDAFHAVFCAVPGESHRLGVTMAADHMRRHGWHVRLADEANHDLLVDDISREVQVIIGITASNTNSLLPLARLIVALRVHNPGVWIIVGGRLAEIEGNLRQMVDADAVETNLELAEQLMEAQINEVRQMRQA